MISRKMLLGIQITPKFAILPHRSARLLSMFVLANVREEKTRYSPMFRHMRRNETPTEDRSRTRTKSPRLTIAIPMIRTGSA
jgi:hypothetical protein